MKLASLLILLALVPACGADLVSNHPDAGGAPPIDDDGDDATDDDAGNDDMNETMDAGVSPGADAGLDAAAGKDAGEGPPLPKPIRVLCIAEYDPNHAPFVEAAKPWLDTIGELTITYVDNPNAITDEMLEDYGLILQLNYPAFAWDDEAKAAFQRYIEEGKGGWVGLHHASLYGSLVTDESWPWFYDFLGRINFKGYIASFAAADVRVEATSHPIFHGVPQTFHVEADEWYTWDDNPRDHTTVLANVDEDSYTPDSDVKMGDHPVIWTNEDYAARNLYIFVGHHPNLMENEAYKTLLRNAIFWAGREAR
jgi:type 1 glutamine amidotransferase